MPSASDGWPFPGAPYLWFSPVPLLSWLWFSCCSSTCQHKRAHVYTCNFLSLEFTYKCINNRDLFDWGSYFLDGGKDFCVNSELIYWPVWNSPSTGTWMFSTKKHILIYYFILFYFNSLLIQFFLIWFFSCRISSPFSFKLDCAHKLTSVVSLGRTEIIY